MTKKIVIASIVLITLFLSIYFLKQEQFVDSLNKKHGCIAFSETMPPSISFSSPLKGWCSTSDFGINSNDTDDFIHSGKSNFKCPPLHSSLSPQESLKYKSKARCVNQKTI